MNSTSEEVKIVATSQFYPQVQQINSDLFADENWHAYTPQELEWGMVSEELLEIPKELVPY
jgi:hypothetical protein